MSGRRGDEPREDVVRVDAGGWRLGARVVRAERPVGVAVLLHAMMVDGRTMRRPAAVLARNGWTSLVADYRGRGLSGGVGDWGYDELVREDVPAFLDVARRTFPGLPVWLVGHSLGGHTAVAAAVEGHLADGYVLVAANVWMPSLEPSRRRRLAKAAAMRSFSLASRGGRFPSRRLGMGPVDEPRRYVEDLVGFWRRDRWASADGVDWLAGLPSVDRPVLSVLGAGDRLLGHPVAARRWAELLPRATVEVVDDGWNPGHMALCTDPRAEPLWERIAAAIKPSSHQAIELAGLKA